MAAETQNEFSELEVGKYLAYCLSLGEKFEKPPQVTLELMSRSLPGQPEVGATDIASTVAFGCYNKGVSPLRPRPEDRAVRVAADTLNSGHHTTREHGKYMWKLVGVTRLVTHDVFHNDPFNVSDQQSQRWVEIVAGNYQSLKGLTDRQRGLYLRAANFMNGAYFDLLGAIKPDMDKRMHLMYPAAGWKSQGRREFLEGKEAKLCQEVARYVIPIGQLTTFDHSLEEIQLLRLFRGSQSAHFSDEARYVIAKMVQSVLDVDPTFVRELKKPLPTPSRPATNEQYIMAHKVEFDNRLDGRGSKMEAIDPSAREQLANAVRGVLGYPSTEMSTTQALDWLMDPAKNQFLADVYDTGIVDPVTACLRKISVSFETKLSHTADSQRQRHRRTPGQTPPIMATYDGKPDYIRPLVIAENPELREAYDRIMATAYQYVNDCIDAGVPQEAVELLIPNAHALRISESGDLYDWFHRFRQRLCFRAQEEISRINMEQAEQIIEAIPDSAKMIAAPCKIRQDAGVAPRCPEGKDWCGQPVFRMKLTEYASARLI